MRDLVDGVGIFGWLEVEERSRCVNRRKSLARLPSAHIYYSVYYYVHYRAYLYMLMFMDINYRIKHKNYRTGRITSRIFFPINSIRNLLLTRTHGSHTKVFWHRMPVALHSNRSTTVQDIKSFESFFCCQINAYSFSFLLELKKKKISLSHGITRSQGSP